MGNYVIILSAGSMRTEKKRVLVSTQSSATDIALEWCQSVGRSAEIKRERDSITVTRYWRDDTGLHYLIY